MKDRGIFSFVSFGTFVVLKTRGNGVAAFDGAT